MILSCNGLSVLTGGKEVLKNISFEVDKPQLIGLLGPNGAGKSTLIRALMSLIPFSGQINHQGLSDGGADQNALAQKVAYLPQERKVHWDICCRDIVMLGRIPHQPKFGRSSDEDRGIVWAAMQQMGVAEFADRPYDSLSGGEQARVLIARTLAQQTDVIIADEPTSGLDPAYQIEMMQMFMSLVDAGKTVLVSLHDLPLASNWCDRILLMKAGALIADAPPVEAMSTALMQQVFGISVAVLPDTKGTIVVPVDKYRK